MDDDVLRTPHARARRRAGAQMLLIIGPIGIIVALLQIFGPLDHPPGDWRDDIAFRLLTFGLFIAFDIALIVGAVRLLRRDVDGG